MKGGGGSQFEKTTHLEKLFSKSPTLLGIINSKLINFSSNYLVTQYQCALCKSVQEQLFCNLYKLFPYVLYNIKYLLVISHLGGYRLSLIVTYSMSSANYALVLGNRAFSNLLFHETLLFRLYLRK